MNTTATNSTPGSKAWMRRTTDSDFMRNRMFVDQKLYSFVIQTNYSLDYAHMYCPAIGAKVASLTSVQKFEFYSSVLAEVGYGYMGMKDTAVAGLFVDEYGNTNPWSLNYPGEPGRHGNTEDCLIIWFDGTKYFSHDDGCFKKGPFICEFPRKKQDIGCYETPPKPEGAVYQNWDGQSFPIPVVTSVTSVCPPGQRLHTGIPVYSTTCESNGYWSRPPNPVPFCTGTTGYVSSNTSTACYKLLQETVVYPTSAEAHCQIYGGRLLPFTYATLPIFQQAFFPEPSAVTGYKVKMVIAGYDDVQLEGNFVDALGNPIPLSWGSNEPDGTPGENYAYLWLDNYGYYGLFDEPEVNYASVICQFSSC